MASIQELKREFTKAIQNSTAAIFAGAGMSCASGLVDWKGLMRNLALDIRLDVDKEEDLVSVAQYYYNEKAGRGAINQKLMNCFTNYEKSNKNMEIFEYSRAVTPQVRQAGNRLSGLTETTCASLLA